MNKIMQVLSAVNDLGAPSIEAFEKEFMGFCSHVPFSDRIRRIQSRWDRQALYNVAYHQVSNGIEFVLTTPTGERVLGIRSLTDVADLAETIKGFDEIKKALTFVESIFPVWIDINNGNLGKYHTQRTCGYTVGRPRKRMEADSIVASRLNLESCKDCQSQGLTNDRESDRIL